MELPPQPRELRPPIVALPEPIPMPPELVIATDAARDDEAFARASAEHTAESYGAYLRSFPNGRHATEAWAGVSAVAPTIGVNEERQGSLTADILHPETRTPIEVWTLRGEAWTAISVELVSDGFEASLVARDKDTGNTFSGDLVPGSNAGIITYIPPSGALTVIVGAADADSRGDYLLRTETFPTIGVNEERASSLTEDGFFHPGTEAPVQVWILRGEAGTRVYVDVVTEAFDAYLVAWELPTGEELTADDLAAGNSARKELTITDEGDVALVVSANRPTSGGAYLLRTRTPEEEERLAQLAERDDGAWETARSVGTAAAYGGYLTVYPSGRHADEAQRLLVEAKDDEAYERARADHTVAAYEQYLTEYPNGRHADEARRLLAEASDDEAYDQAQAEDTSSAYQAYLRGYANGRHADNARRMLAAARSREESRPGRRFQDCDECPLMVVVPPGSYMMGSPESARRRERDEQPQHIVTIEYPLAVGTYEVTVAEYRRFVASTGHSARAICWRWTGEWSRYRGTWSNPGYPQTERDPVVCVSWEDAMEYARWLSRETGEKYRLLSESEWEYVARGGTNTATYWGEESAESFWADASAESQCRYANGADRTLRTKDRHQDWEWEYAACEDGYHRTAPVGTYEANGYGLHDVLGNVWEWTQDCKSENYEGVPSDGRSWESEACDRRVIRGGSWSDDLDNIRSGNRGWANTDHRDYTLGFRVARTIRF